MRDWLATAVDVASDRVFLETPSDSVTFGDVADRVGRWASGSMGDLEPGSRIGVWARNEPEAVAALLAVPRAGLIPLLLDPRWPAHRARRVVTGAGAVAVAGRGPDLGIPAVDANGSSQSWQAEVDPSSIHSVVFTSGTTGPPKGVRLTWGNLDASAAATRDHLDHVASDRWLAVLPMCHVGGLGIVVRSLRERSVVVLEPSFDPERAAMLLGGQVTLASLVTATLRQVLDAGRRFSGVRAVLVGGGPVPASIVASARAAGLVALATYGMTETASGVATASMSAPDPDWLEPLSGVELSVTGDGRIAVGGPMVAPGYLDEPDWPLPFVTRDRGVFADGRLRVVGRTGDVFASGGENVDPLEVEDALRSIPGVRDAVVVGVPDETWGWMVAAMVELDSRASLEGVKALARSDLASFQLPRRWLVVEGLPRLGTGKVDRAAAAVVLRGE
ncbi:MAG TPA: AMP-binding protein [Acidimicrobiia bacterium]